MTTWSACSSRLGYRRETDKHGRPKKHPKGRPRKVLLETMARLNGAGETLDISRIGLVRAVLRLLAAEADE